MLAAIGIILILKQAPVAIGYMKDSGIQYQIGSIIIALVSVFLVLAIIIHTANY